MKEPNTPDRQFVKDFMVKSPMIVEDWQPIAHARQIMLTHSFSFLPVCIDKRWKLISEGALARYLRSDGDWKSRLSLTIKNATSHGLELYEADIVKLNVDVKSLLFDNKGTFAPRLWLVEDDHHKICGILTPFELM